MLTKMCLLLLPCAPTLLAVLNPTSYVSGGGHDVDPCTRALPCATFTAAIAQTIAGGEVDALDSGEFGGFTLTQAMTIDGGANNVATITGVNCINVSAGASDTVVLRNLSCQAGSQGIYVSQVGFMRIEHMKVTVAGGSDGIFIAGGTVVLRDIRVSGATSAPGGALMATGSSTKVSVSNSSFVSSIMGIDADLGATLQADHVVCAYNDIGVSSNRNGLAGTGGTVRLSNTVITDNTLYGLKPTNNANLITGSIISFGNNRIYKNGTDGNPTQAQGLR
jgi:hypothetical protein